MMKSNSDKSREILEINDFNKSFDLLIQNVKKLRILLNTLNFEYINKITGTINIPKNTDYYLIRDSLNFRVDSILFHLRILQSIQLNQYNQLNKSKDKQLEMHNHKFEFLDQQFQLFDSIIFHTISLFDYIGNLTGSICIRKPKMKWDGIMNSVNDKNNPFSSKDISFILKKINNELVDKLYNFRSELIHYSKAKGGFQFRHNLFANDMKLTVFAPIAVCKKFHELKLLSKDNEISINYALFWIVEKTLTSVSKIIEDLLIHIDKNRRIPIGSELFGFEPAIKKSL